jgi:hypothetical protein
MSSRLTSCRPGWSSLNRGNRELLRGCEGTTRSLARWMSGWRPCCRWFDGHHVIASNRIIAPPHARVIESQDGIGFLRTFRYTTFSARPCLSRLGVRCRIAFGRWTRAKAFIGNNVQLAISVTAGGRTQASRCPGTGSCILARSRCPRAGRTTGAPGSRGSSLTAARRRFGAPGPGTSWVCHCALAAGRFAGQALDVPVLADRC